MSQPQRSPFDPYAHYRANVFVPPGATTGPVPPSWIRMWKLACGILQIILLFVALGFYVAGVILRGEDGISLVLVGAGVFVLAYAALVAYAILQATWLYRIWNWFPPEQRYSKIWGGYISPWRAVGFLFIPYFNVFWMFVVFLGVADILERMQVAYPTSKPAPKTLALLTLLVPIVFFPIGPFMHFFFAAHVESMASEMQARIGRPVG